MSRRLSGEATPAEVEELTLLLESSPQKQYLYSLLHSWFTDLPSTAPGQPAEDPDFEERLLRILNKPGEQKLPAENWNTTAVNAATVNPAAESITATRVFRKRILYITSVAASIIAIFFLTWSIYHKRSVTTKPLRPAPYEEVLAKAGTRTKLVLPDGTQVWLNSNSKLRYSNEFNRESREVGLEGEAYFDVAKDIQRPFIVHTSSLEIRVLGTSFTIKSYPQDETIEATLLKGTIEVRRKDNPNTARVILKPNEKLVFNKRTASSGRSSLTPDRGVIHSPSTLPDMAVNSIRKDIPDSDKVETAWMYNRLVFKGDNFMELAEKMQRWYNVRITIRDSSLNNYHFGGAFAGETVEEAFKALQLTSAFRYKINNNEIEIYAK
ncbi:MAG TPA: FecR domain-containing protein [Puia sp.]|nr:FecR domain-containing protein [Puia sp.]